LRLRKEPSLAGDEQLARSPSARPLAREAAAPEPGVSLDGIEEVVGDKGYHSGAASVAMKEAEVRTYILEKKQAGKRHSIGKKDQQQAVYANRLRVSRTYGKRLLRKRGELIERSSVAVTTQKYEVPPRTARGFSPVSARDCGEFAGGKA